MLHLRYSLQNHQLFEVALLRLPRLIARWDQFHEQALAVVAWSVEQAVIVLNLMSKLYENNKRNHTFEGGSLPLDDGAEVDGFDGVCLPDGAGGGADAADVPAILLLCSDGDINSAECD